MSSAKVILFKHRPALAILTVYLMLATFFSLSVPPWEATDESAHFDYANFLLLNRRLPLQSIDPAKQETVMAHYPPLYYALLAAIIAPFDRSDLAQSATLNRAYVWGDPSSGGYNLMLHDRVAEEFPFRGSILALHVGRLLSVVSGAVVVVAAYKLGLMLFGMGSPLALGMMMVTAFLPSFLFTSSTIHNDGLASAFGAVVLLRIFDFVHKPARAKIMEVALLLGLATLAKSTTIVMVALLPLALAITWWRDRDAAKALRWFGLALGVFLTITGWWLVRNQILYGDPLGFTVFSQNPIFPLRPRPLTLPTLLGEVTEEWSPLSQFWRTLIVSIGYMDIYGPASLYYVVWAVAAMAVIGLVATAVRWRQHWREWLPDVLLAIAAGFLIYATVVQHALGYSGGAHGRYIFPVLPIVSVGVVLGIAGLVPRGLARRAIMLPGLGLFFLAALTPSLFILPTYALGNRLSEQQAAALTANRDATFGGLIRLVHAEVVPNRVAPGGQVIVTLYWQALADIKLSYRVMVELLSLDLKLAARSEGSPGYGRAATNLWRQGDVISDTFVLQIAGDAPIGPYRLATGFYEMPDVTRLPVQGRDAGGDLATLGQIKILTATSPAPGLPLAQFADQIALLQAELIPQSRQPDAAIVARLTWLARTRPDADYTVSIQLLSSAGLVVAQHDSPPREGTFPTSSWEEGDVIPDTVLIALPDQAAGELDAFIILYDRATAKRLRSGSGEAYYLGKVRAY